MKSIIPVQRMKPYNPPLENRRSFDGDLLDFSERTISPSPKVIAALNDFIANGSLNTYPEYGTLTTDIANYVKVNPDQILITNGSDSGINIIFRTFAAANDQVIISQPSFAIFAQAAGVIGNQILTPAYNLDLTYPIDQVLAAITPDTKIITICNPNNPTGSIMPLPAIKKIAQASLQTAPNSIVYIDEAYYEFSQLTAVPLLKEFPNIIISRTFSKAFGIAALRIGYLIAAPELIAEMNKIRGPYEVNMPAVIAAQAALQDLPAMTNYRDEVMNQAKPLVEKFFHSQNIKFYPSASNYILFSPKNSEQLNQYFLENKIRLRPRSGPNIENTLRVSIGTTEQMKRFIRVYQFYLDPAPKKQ